MVATDPRERLLELAGERRVSLAQLSAMIGRNSSYLQQFVRKRSPRKLEETDRAMLAGFFGVGEGELGGVEDISYIVGKSPRAGWIAIPRLPLDASAGPGVLSGEERPFDSFGFSADWLRAQNLDPAMLSMIQVSGDSMYPSLNDGDEILVDRSPRPLREGIHVVRVDDAVLVKRLDTGRPGFVALVSDNSIYARVELPAREVQVVGRVVWKGGRL
jgi:hypothetical protein